MHDYKIEGTLVKHIMSETSLQLMASVDNSAKNIALLCFSRY